MIAVDTNIIVRLMINDNAKQVSKARSLVVENNIAITSGVLIETVWVLGRTYALDRPAIARSLAALLALPNIAAPWPGSVQSLLDCFLAGMDFADVVHLLDAKALGCNKLASFDEKLRKQAVKRTIDIDVVAP